MKKNTRGSAKIFDEKYTAEWLNPLTEIVMLEAAEKILPINPHLPFSALNIYEFMKKYHDKAIPPKEIIRHLTQDMYDKKVEENALSLTPDEKQIDFELPRDFEYDLNFVSAEASPGLQKSSMPMQSIQQTPPAQLPTPAPTPAPAEASTSSTTATSVAKEVENLDRQEDSDGEERPKKRSRRTPRRPK